MFKRNERNCNPCNYLNHQITTLYRHIISKTYLKGEISARDFWKYWPVSFYLSFNPSPPVLMHWTDMFRSHYRNTPTLAKLIFSLSSVLAIRNIFYLGLHCVFKLVPTVVVSQRFNAPIYKHWGQHFGLTVQTVWSAAIFGEYWTACIALRQIPPMRSYTNENISKHLNCGKVNKRLQNRTTSLIHFHATLILNISYLIKNLVRQSSRIHIDMLLLHKNEQIISV